MPTNRIAISAALTIPVGVLVAAGVLSAGDPGLRVSDSGAQVTPVTTIIITTTTTEEVAPTGGPAGAPGAPEAVTTADDAVSRTTQGVGPAVATTADVPATQVQPPSPPPVETSFTVAPTGLPHPGLGEPECVDVGEVDALAAVFGGALIIGADYQRAFPLPTGRVLWLFQDAFLPTAHGPELVHNVGLLQSGSCFQLLRSGSTERPTPYLFPELTDRYDRWFWPLGGEVGEDGHLHVFVAEMVEHGSGYLQHTEPVATWLVTIDADDLAVVDRRLAPDPSAHLYGWSVVSSGAHTYLYAHCYRQFGWGRLPFVDSPPKTHDWSCTRDVTVARIPRGRLDVVPQYWNGTEWTDDASVVVPVFPTEGRSVNAVQVGVLDGRFISVTKVGDWWGDTIYLEVAPTPHGPWETYETMSVEPRCPDCNTYFASIVPFGADAVSFSIALSNNTWGGHDLLEYRPTVHRAPAP